ncbi:MAG: hypothetical protein ACFFCQ_07245 [Promethearchaeota archaeon]
MVSEISGLNNLRDYFAGDHYLRNHTPETIISETTTFEIITSTLTTKISSTASTPRVIGPEFGIVGWFFAIIVLGLMALNIRKQRNRIISHS